MKENYIESYFDLEGHEYTRKSLSKRFIKVFAGTKFMTDRLLALFGLIIFLPLMLIISIIIKLDSKGPVLFKQIRTGKGGKEIYIYKFRSMVANNNVRDFSKQDEHTKVGTFLRKTSLDELPQLISILKGDMSFIGPRPWIPEYYENMDEIQRHRCDVRPGLTGLAQCMGRNNITIFDKINYDLKYIKDYSLRQDIKIIFLTIKTVFSKKGADAGKGTIHDELEELKTVNERKKVKSIDQYKKEINELIEGNENVANVQEVSVV